MRKILCALAVTGLVVVSLADAGGAAPGRTVLPGSTPTWAVAARRVRAADSSVTVDFRVYLPFEGGDAAGAYALSASTPGSANAGKFLSPEQFRARYSPTQQSAAAVTSWLRKQGFTIGTTPANRHYVEAVGTVAQAAAAFSTTFSDYSYSGATLRAPDSALSVPEGLPAISAVVGLDESMALVKTMSGPKATPSPAFVNGRPCSQYWGEKTVLADPALDGTALPDSPAEWAPCGYAGAQLQGAYGFSSAIGSGNDGAGVTVAVIDAYASPTIADDIETYSGLHGLPTTRGLFSQVVAPGTFVRPQNNAQDPQGWAGEETLDVEAVHTMAPGASIVYVGAPNNYSDLDAAMNHVVDRRLADIVTNSYGFSSEALPPGYIKPFNDTLIQAAAEGMSVVFSSGDNADETDAVAGATPTPDWPASSPWVTAVGGTSLGVDSSNGRQFELGWATRKAPLADGPAWGTAAWLYGSGGGTSRLFTQPSYQAGVVPDSIATTYGGPAMRVVPDVAAVGDPTTGMLVGQTQRFPDGTDKYSEFRLGGTSLSSPLFAGMLADALQLRGTGLGLANPALYAAGAAAYSDITKTDLATYPGAVRADYVNGVDDTDGYVYTARYFDQDDDLTIHVRPGYDDITGMGSPNGAAWLAAMS